MKKKTTSTLSTLFILFSAFVFTFLFSHLALAENSFELTCRTKAKELAAETYKGCMTENRQVQLETIRKEYKEELANLKNQYDKKLKKLSGDHKKNDDDNRPQIQPLVTKSNVEGSVQLRKNRTRASGARQIAKPAAIGTQVIDLAEPVDAQINEPEESLDTARLEKKNGSDNNNEVEIVELQPQQ